MHDTVAPRRTGELDEPELVRRLQRGDGAAFDEAYRRHHARLHGFVARMHGRRDGVDDVLQETWLRLARHAVRLRPDTQLGAWLFTVARNLVLGRQRWRLLDAERLIGFARMPAPDEPTPFDLSQASETERRLELALAALPVKYREVLLLIAIEGLTPQAAAAILELKPEATRQRLARARAMMQTLLEDGR
jgi:RNA polymerase sigma-70 factor (ECF subfamily)